MSHLECGFARGLWGGGPVGPLKHYFDPSSYQPLEGVSCLGLSLRFDITLIVEQLFPTCSGGQSGCIVCYYVRWYDRSRPPVIPARSKSDLSKLPRFMSNTSNFCCYLFTFINNFSNGHHQLHRWFFSYDYMDYIS